MKSYKHCINIGIVLLSIFAYSNPVYSQNKLNKNQLQTPKNTNSINWLQLRHILVEFPNKITVQLLIAHSRKPHRYVENIAPDEKRFIVSDEKTLWDEYKDHSLYDEKGMLIGLITSKDNGWFSGFWSHSQRYYISATGSLYDLEKLKFIEHIYGGFEWSLIDDRLVHSRSDMSNIKVGDLKDPKDAIVSEIHDNELVSHNTSTSELSKLVGDAYIPALHAGYTIDPYWLGSGYATQDRWSLFHRYLNPSPNGRRVLLQGFRHHVYDWTDNNEDICYFLIVDKNGKKIEDSSSGERLPIFYQWLDNRYLIGWLHPDDVDENYDEKTMFLRKHRKMVLYDTDTGKKWAAQFPRHYLHDALHWRLIGYSGH